MKQVRSGRTKIGRSETDRPRIGRPRSEKARKAVFRATRELLREEGGAGLSVEAVARRAGVGKPTIYRWWPSLADIVLDVLLEQAEADIKVLEDLPVREALRLFLRRSVEVIEQGVGDHLRFLMARAQQDEAFRERFRKRFVAERRGVLEGILHQAAEGGACRHCEPGLVVDMVFGAMWYRLLTGHGPMDESFADALADAAAALATGADS